MDDDNPSPFFSPKRTSTHCSMAPRRKIALAKRGQNEDAHHPNSLQPALPCSRIVNVEGLDKVRHLVGGQNNEWGETRLKVAGTRESDATDAPIFVVFFAAGLVPPISAFFCAVLEHYQIHLLHLRPNAILTLSLFAHLCEAFVGVMLSLQLFRHFSSMCLSRGDQTSGCVSFILADGEDDPGFPDLGLHSVSADWRQRWVLADLRESGVLFQAPSARAVEHKGWRRAPVIDRA